MSVIEPMISRCTIFAEVGFEVPHIEGDDGGGAVGREARDEAVADFAAGAGDEDSWSAHGDDSLDPPGRVSAPTCGSPAGYGI